MSKTIEIKKTCENEKITFIFQCESTNGLVARLWKVGHATFKEPE